MNALTFIRPANAVIGRVLPGLSAEAARRMLMTPRRLKPRDWEQPAILSAERITLRNGCSALRWGSHGPLALCIHGWEGRASQFAAFIDPLLSAGFQVVSLDAPAHGHSQGKEAHPIAFAQALLDAAEELGSPTVTMGHSMGAGAVAIAISRGLKTERAVLIAGPSAFENVLNRFATFIRLPEGARKRFLSKVETHTQAPLESVDIRQISSQFDMPALIIHDQDDVMMPLGEAGQIAKHWPLATLLITTTLGHYRVMRDKNVIDAVVRYVKPQQQLKAAA